MTDQETRKELPKGYFVVRIDVAELACIIGRASGCMECPEGLTAREVIEMLSDDARDMILDQAIAAAEYFANLLTESQKHVIN
jgi:hypothetical protein